MPGDAVHRLLLAVSGMLSARTLAIAGGGGGGQSMHLRSSYCTNVLHHATARQSALLYTPQAGRRMTAFLKPSGPVSRAAPFRSAWERATTRRQAKPATPRLIVPSGAGQAASAGWCNEDALFSAGSGGSHARRRHRNGGGRAGRGLALAMSAVGRPQQLARLSWPTASLSSYTRPDGHVEAGSSVGDVPGPGHDLASKQGVSIPERGVSATRESSAAPGAGSRRYLAHSGSRLYGTNTAKSDVDLKGIFIPDVQKEEEARRAASQVKAVAKAQQDMGGDTAVPGDAKEARVPSSSSPALSPKGSGKGKEITFWYSTSNCDSRNTVDDVDLEIISLGRFFGQLIRGEIGGVETLHSMLVRDVELISDPEASTTAAEMQNKRVSAEEPAGEAGDPSRVSSRGGGGEGAGQKSKAVDTAPAWVAVGDKEPPVRKLGVIGRKKAPTRVVKDVAPEEAPRLGVMSRPGTGDVESRGAASSQGARRLGVLSRGGVKMGGERVAEQEVHEEEEEEDWEEKETARTLKRGKLLMHARRGVMEAEELLTAGRLSFPLKPRYVEELRRLKELDMGPKKLSSIQAQAKQLSAVAATSGLPAQVSMEKLRAVQEEVMRVHDQRRRRGVGPLPAVEAK
ncbi:hypothetical protein Esi_0051_0060 [Ectocarpus siliculosus]|uniref:Polymerase nucleotidyl transferase domain-containing protein n=1 Tax=Ectocarpus siliculosus TaxID=2880 RepID=D7G3H5_ECTSI|nr:hypothetical protein Esi_0051_0060 [Ectocarpus siliculosus]|eukprot:CBJ26973.1 hypothetical protein Esi_0051_0060 [Ectocarpus siliculosus]